MKIQKNEQFKFQEMEKYQQKKTQSMVMQEEMIHRRKKKKKKLSMKENEGVFQLPKMYIYNNPCHAELYLSRSFPTAELF